MAAGYSPYSLIAAGTTNATNVKPAPGELHGWAITNTAAYTVWLKFYDSATAPTAGSGTPVLRFGIPAGAAANFPITENGALFLNGLGFTITKLQADNDTTVVVAGDLVVNLFYR